MINQPPDGIIVTLPANFFSSKPKDNGYPGGMEEFLRVFKLVDKGEIQWNHTISAVPKHEVYLLYFVYQNKIFLKAHIDGFDKGDKKFYDGGVERIFTAKCWVKIIGPVEFPTVDYPMKGFRGFRYTQKIF